MSLREGPAGWGSVAGLAVVTAMLSTVNPGLLLVVPFALLLLALPPRRPLQLAMAVMLAVLVLSGPRGGLVWYFERGWALLLGACFVLAIALLPGRSFLTRGLLALGGAGVVLLPFLWLNRGLFDRLDLAIGTRLRDAAAQAAAAWNRMGNRPGDAEGSGGLQLGSAIEAAAELQALLFPALLALASLAALAVAWWGFRRIADREREPLRPLREFAFPNDLVWLLIVGIALVLIPGLSEGWARVGSNTLAFMAALYALRGVAVLVVIGGAPGPFGLFVGLLAVLFLYPLVMATAVLVGLTDTWLDIRARRGART